MLLEVLQRRIRFRGEARRSWLEVVVGRGIEQAFDGFLAMLDGATYGKALVQI